MGITKKQHYVPRLYLKRFSNPKTKQLYVYDKKIRQVRKSNIDDAGEANHFYDLNYSLILDEKGLEKLKDIGYSLDDLDKMQIVENELGRVVEPIFNEMLEGCVNVPLIDRVFYRTAHKS